MAKFQFRLATLLKLREATRDEKRAQLGEAEQARHKLEQMRAEKEAEIASLRASYGAAMAPGTLDVDQLANAQRFDAVLQAEKSYLADQNKLLDEELERRIGVLVEADREVRVLEKLRGRQQQRHVVHEHRREIKQFDEIAGTIRREEVHG